MGAQFFSSVSVVVVVGSLFASSATAQSVGRLVCQVPGGPAALRNSRRIDCNFVQDSDKKSEHYFGMIETSGPFFAEIVGDTRETWSVDAPTPSVPPGALAGVYTGGVGQITVVGFGFGGFGLRGGDGGAYSLSHGPFDLRLGMGVKYGGMTLTLHAAQPEQAVSLAAMDAKRSTK